MTEQDSPSGWGGHRTGNPTYKLDQLDRDVLTALARMELWNKTELAAAFGVSRKTVHKHQQRADA